MNILSVESWLDSQDFEETEGSWAWNSWHKVGECESCENENQAWVVFEKHFGFTIDRDKYHVEDDQHNFTLCVTSEGARPIYAIEYGAYL